VTGHVLGFGVALVVAVAAALPLRRLAVRLGVLDHPGERKLQKAAVPYLGGAAVMLGLLAGAVVLAGAHLGALAGVLAVLAGAQAVGLYDDVRGLRPATKLLAQVALAAIAAALGLSVRLTHVAPLDAGLTIVWLVAVANAFNLMDNMDGLCGTVAAVAGIGLALLAPATAVLALPLAGAACGFLVFNLPPARMYLGDAGSLTIGFGLGMCAVLASNTGAGPQGIARLVLPVAFVLFDTSLVTASRLLAGRPVHRGGLDHSSHRLRRLGASRWLVLVVAAAAAAAGPLAAWALSRYPEPVAWLAALVAALFVVGWLTLLRLDPYRPVAATRPEGVRV
jgi:UDP-GlcNAc:undecaprenyl-phosphate GlcNAc-1-phosphate transferase